MPDCWNILLKTGYFRMPLTVVSNTSGAGTVLAMFKEGVGCLISTIWAMILSIELLKILDAFNQAPE